MNTDTDIEVQDMQTIETSLRMESREDETASGDLVSAAGFTAGSASAFLVS
jgi:hypothetical protein